MNIPIVGGEIRAEDMGITYMHEHVFTPVEPKYRAMALDYAELELKNIALMGAKTFVDVGPSRWRKNGLQLNLGMYEEIASRVPELNIICCTGYHWAGGEALKKLLSELEDKDEDQMADEMVEDITNGIKGSRIKAGLIKVGSTGAKLRPHEEKIFTAAGKAQAATGVPICTHAIHGQLAQMRALEKAGADLERVYYSHIECKMGWEGRSLDEEAGYLAAIAKSGGSLLFNNFALEQFTTWPDLIYLLRDLKDNGLSDRILISMDWNFHMNELGQVELEDEGKWPGTVVRVPSYIFTWVIPVLKKEGFTKEDMDQWLVHTPARIFSGRRV